MTITLDMSKIDNERNNMNGEIHIDHIWRYEFCEIIFSLEYGRSIIAQICRVYDNGIEIEVIDPKDYPIYRKGERVYIQSFPGIQIKFIRKNNLKEYLCQQKK